MRRFVTRLPPLFSDFDFDTVRFDSCRFGTAVVDNMVPVAGIHRTAAAADAAHNNPAEIELADIEPSVAAAVDRDRC